MRKHLLAQLKNKTMTKRVKRGKEVTHSFSSYCKYRVPFFEDDPKEDKRFFMAFFLVCGEWYHKRRENILVVIFRDEKNCCMEMFKLQIETETYQIERFF